MIDLHIHTKNSDGTNSVIEILKKAQEKELTYISITDHDNCNGYEELEKIDIKEYYQGVIIPGIEIKCSYGRNLIEVLGYKIDTKKMKKWTEEFYKDKSRDKIQNKYFNILYDKCLEKGLTMKEKEEIKWNPKNDWASVTIYNEIKEHEENREKLPIDLWNEFDVFSKKYCGNPECEFYIDKTPDYPTTEQAIDAIKSCGGLVFLPHLFIYKWAEDKKELINKILEQYSIDGIECMHSSFTDEQINYLIEICDNNHYYKSGGSDYHGANKPNIELGIGKGNLYIPDEFVKKWVSRDVPCDTLTHFITLT
ncbi:MAG: PHP domain-containing protein [Clostridia bacterium]|nr:PHP domain-containing protein [Clostridia bacterium]